MAKLKKCSYPWKWRDEMDREYAARMAGEKVPAVNYRKKFKEEHAAFIKLCDASEALPKGQIVGGVLSFGMADGAAHYIVTKEKPLTIQWIPYGDGYSIAAAHVRGINKQDVLLQIEGQRNSPFKKAKGK